MGRSIVYKYNNGKAQEVEIIAGIRTESEVQILEGFREGDTAIISGVMQLRSGMNVVIDNLKQE
jgi:membrane fusion protein (multidrug efflux system)